MHNVVVAPVVITLTHDIAALKFVKVAGSTGIGWVWQLKLRVPPLVDPRAVEIDVFAVKKKNSNPDTQHWNTGMVW